MDLHTLMLKATQLGLYDVEHLTYDEIVEEIEYATLSKEARCKYRAR
jgi:hypothetical protein